MFKRSTSPERNLAEIHPEHVDRRNEFVPAAFHRLSNEEPALCIQGQINDDVVEDDGSRCQVMDQVLRQVMPTTKKNEIESGGFDFVLIYDAAQSKLFLGDERHPSGITSENYFMRADLGGGKITINISDGGEVPPLDVLLDPNSIVHSGCYKPALILFRVVEQILEAGHKLCLIIDYPDQMCSGSDSGVNEARLFQLIKQCEGTNNRIVLMDRNNGVNGEIKPNTLSYTMPGTTEADAKILLGSHFSGDQLVLAAKLSIRTRAGQIVQLANEHGKSGKFFEKLREERARAIEKDSGGLLRASFQPISDAQIALPPEQKRYWEELAAACRKDPTVLGNGSLLIGPPGTGKSVAPKYVASLLGLPYVEMSDLSTSGLSNVSLDRAKRCFEALRAHAPCILRIDEISKVFPNIESSPFRNNNDEQLMAFIQTTLADDEFMKGIMVIGTDNFPEHLSTALLRHGRFGNKIAMLPPQTRSEKVAVFKAVWHQKPLLCNHHTPPDDTVIATLVETLPAFAMGGDYGELLDRVATKLLSGSKTDLWEALQEATAYMAETLVPVPRYQEIVAESLRLHNAFEMNPPAESEEAPLLLTKEQAAFLTRIGEQRALIAQQLESLRSFRAQTGTDFEAQQAELEKTRGIRIKEMEALQQQLETMISGMTAEAEQIQVSTSAEAKSIEEQVAQLQTLIDQQKERYEQSIRAAEETLKKRQEEIRKAQQAATQKHRDEKARLAELQRSHSEAMATANAELEKAIQQLERDRQKLEATVQTKVAEATKEATEILSRETAAVMAEQVAELEKAKQRSAEVEKLKRLLARQKESQTAQTQTIERQIEFIGQVSAQLLEIAQTDGLDARVAQLVKEKWKEMDQRVRSLRLMGSGGNAEQKEIDALSDSDGS